MCWSFLPLIYGEGACRLESVMRLASRSITIRPVADRDARKSRRMRLSALALRAIFGPLQEISLGETRRAARRGRSVRRLPAHGSAGHVYSQSEHRSPAPLLRRMRQTDGGNEARPARIRLKLV